MPKLKKKIIGIFSCFHKSGGKRVSASSQNKEVGSRFSYHNTKKNSKTSTLTPIICWVLVLVLGLKSSPPSQISVFGFHCLTRHALLGFPGEGVVFNASTGKRLWVESFFQVFGTSTRLTYLPSGGGGLIVLSLVAQSCQMQFWELTHSLEGGQGFREFRIVLDQPGQPK